MKVTNARGTPVDPVPFLVVATTGILVSYVYLPAYFLAFGASVPLAVGGATVVAALLSAWSFHRYCWTARPDLQREVPTQERFKRLVYGMAIFAGLLLLLALPFFL